MKDLSRSTAHLALDPRVGALVFAALRLNLTGTNRARIKRRMVRGEAKLFVEPQSEARRTA